MQRYDVIKRHRQNFLTLLQNEAVKFCYKAIPVIIKSCASNLLYQKCPLKSATIPLKTTEHCYSTLPNSSQKCSSVSHAMRIYCCKNYAQQMLHIISEQTSQTASFNKNRCGLNNRSELWLNTTFTAESLSLNLQATASTRERLWVHSHQPFIRRELFAKY